MEVIRESPSSSGSLAGHQRCTKKRNGLHPDDKPLDLSLRQLLQPPPQDDARIRERFGLTSS
jgi:hypothetical protein